MLAGRVIKLHLDGRGTEYFYPVVMRGAARDARASVRPAAKGHFNIANGLGAVVDDIHFDDMSGAAADKRAKKEER